MSEKYVRINIRSTTYDNFILEEIDMKLFNKVNVNPLKKKVGDCSIRAISTATGKDWDIVFMDLCEIAFDLKCMPNGDEATDQYLKANNFVRIPIKITKGSKRPTVESFTKEHAQGTYVLRVANHMVAVKEGMYHDTWDSGTCCVYSYWVKQDK